MRKILVGASLLLLASMGTAQAQNRQAGVFGGPYFEITPFAGYVWGGGFNTNAINTLPSGRVTLNGGFGWGAEVGWSPNGAGWVEATYLRQDTKLNFQPSGSSQREEVGDFATNYIHIGGRYEFGRQFRPFINGGMGLVVYDPKFGNLGTNTQFSMSVGGGFRYMMGEAQRFGVRANIRGWFGFVPNGTVQVWCDWWGFCAATQGTSTVSQGEVSGGVVFTF